MVSQTFLAFHDLGSLERHCSEVLLDVPSWGQASVFLMMRSGYVCWQEGHGGKVLFQHIILKAQPVTMMHTLTRVTWLQYACQFFFPAPFSLLSRLYSSEGSHSAQPTLWSCALLPFRMKGLNTLPRNFPHSLFVSSPFINAFKNAFMSVWAHMLVYTLCCDLIRLGFPPSFPSPWAVGREPFQLNSMMPWPCLTHISF